jgi:hypothetical protein
MSTQVVPPKSDGNLTFKEISMESLEMKTETNNQAGAEELPKLIGTISEIGNLMKINQIHKLLNLQECSDMEMICTY